MGYLSLYFCVFILITVVLYYSFPITKRWIVLLVASIFFYLSYDKRYFIFLLFSIITTYEFTKQIQLNKKHKKFILFTCISLNIGIWFITKSLNFYTQTFNRILNLIEFPMRLPVLDILIPIGISYYVLQSISYVVDVYRGELSYEKSIFKYALYITWFPAIVQGPISKYKQLAEQLYKGHSFNFESICYSLQLILFGLVKKIVIADQIGIFANYCFENYVDITGFTLYFGALAYTIQLYMDFSGCVDICRGVSNLFGIELINNFNCPYFSKSIKEFWQRWHISLSSWLRDYVYIPLGGNRYGLIRKYINLLIVFLISGIWHGAGFGFIIWGLLHAFYQIIGSSGKITKFSKSFKRLLSIEENSTSDKVYKTFITFHLVAFAWIFFRATSIKGSIIYICNMFKELNLWGFLNGNLFSYGIDHRTFIVLMVNIAMIFFIEYMHIKKGYEFRKEIRKLHIIVRWLIYFLIIYDIILFGSYGAGFNASSFLYGGF